MKTIFGIVMMIATFSSLQVQASTTAISPQCKSKLENILSKKTQFPVEVLYVNEVGPGTWDVEHFILFAEKHVGGQLYRALGNGDAGECPVDIKSVESVYSGEESRVDQNSCMTKAIESSLAEARNAYPGYLAVFPYAAKFVEVKKVNGVMQNVYEVHVQVTTADDYSEQMSFEYKYPNKECVD